MKKPTVTKIKELIKEAMRNKEKVKLSTLRLLLSTIETERGKQGKESIYHFTEEEIEALIKRNLKAVTQEIESLVKAERDTSTQEQEKLILEDLLPEQVSEEELVQVVGYINHGKRGMKIGEVMKELAVQLRGRSYDKGLASRVIKKHIL